METMRCMKCKANKEVEGAKVSKTKNNRNIMKGKCKTCGTTCCRFVK